MRRTLVIIPIAALLLTGLTVGARNGNRLEPDAAFTPAKPGDGERPHPRTSDPDFADNDPTAGTWLPKAASAKASADPATSAVDDFLKPLRARTRLLGCWYDGPRLAASRAFANGQLRTSSGQWSCDLRRAPVAGDADAMDLTLAFELKEGAAASAGVAVAFDFSGWSTNNCVLIPASVYNGNRNRIEYRGYCTGFDEGDFGNKNLPVTHGDVPRLALEPGEPSKIEVSACNASTPALCVFNPRTRRAFIVLAGQGIRDARGGITDHALSVEENADRSRATCVISAPGVRERQPAFTTGFNPSPDRGIDWKAGDKIRRSSGNPPARRAGRSV